MNKPSKYYHLEDVSVRTVIINDNQQEQIPTIRTGIIVPFGNFSNITLVEYQEYIDLEYYKDLENKIEADVYHKSGKFRLVNEAAKTFLEDFLSWLELEDKK